jgi:hypothetical protein
MLKRIVLNFLIVAASVLLICDGVIGQPKSQSVFAPIPAELRNQLIARLDLMLEYDRTNQFENLFSVLSTDWLSKSGVPSDKTGYLAFKREWESKAVGYNLLAFKPISVTKPNSNDVGVYTIRARARLQSRETNRMTEEDYFIEAHWRNCEWYFSEPFTFIT